MRKKCDKLIDKRIIDDEIGVGSGVYIYIHICVCVCVCIHTILIIYPTDSVGGGVNIFSFPALSTITQENGFLCLYYKYKPSRKETRAV